MTPKQIAQIESILQYTFKDKQLLITALTHSSYANLERDKNNQCIENYDRMAFFGDAILKMVIAEYLYGVYPDKSSGAISYMCSNLVSRDSLSKVVFRLDLTKHLRIVSTSNTDLSDHLCADLYEAIACAIYLDGGYPAVKKFILDTLSSSLETVNMGKQKDSKTLLQEYCQRQQPPKTVSYLLAGRVGADNNPTYTIDLYIDNQYMCSGQGASKKAAEQNAAKKIVTEWRID